VARAASLAVRREKAEARKKRSAISTVSELSGRRKTEDVNAETRETQRKLAARAAVMRDLARARSARR
jgi:hypothetical protein